MPFPALAQRMRRGGVAGDRGGVFGGLPPPDFPPANEGTDWNFGGPTVQINPPDLTYNGPSGPTQGGGPGPAPSVPTNIATVGPTPSPGGFDPFGNSVSWPGGGIGPQGQPDDYGHGPRVKAYLQSGGVVPGHRPFGMPHDTVPAMLDPQEIVLNAQQQKQISLSPSEQRKLPPSIVHQMYRSRMGR